MVEIDPVKPNIFNEISDATHGIVTPGNITSGVGFALAFSGALRMDTFNGVMTMGTGRVLDMVDGKFARATNTASPLGEMVDATLDKAAVAVMCVQALRKRIVPVPVIATIAAQNIANAAITVYDRKNNDVPHVHPVKDGKHAMFGQNAAIGLFTLAGLTERPILKRALRAGGWAFAAGSTVKGISATRQYRKQASASLPHSTESV